MSKTIPNLPNFIGERTLTRSDLAEQTGEVSQESLTYFSKLTSFIQLIIIYQTNNTLNDAYKFWHEFIIWLICKNELYKNHQFTEICR